ncbi:MAG: hypothetical protein ACTS7I_01450 [Candidatus Hodgkinia cicadicola]
MIAAHWTKFINLLITFGGTFFVVKTRLTNDLTFYALNWVKRFRLVININGTRLNRWLNLRRSNELHRMWKVSDGS